MNLSFPSRQYDLIALAHTIHYGYEVLGKPDRDLGKRLLKRLNQHVREGRAQFVCAFDDGSVVLRNASDHVIKSHKTINSFRQVTILERTDVSHDEVDLFAKLRVHVLTRRLGLLHLVELLNEVLIVIFKNRVGDLTQLRLMHLVGGLYTLGLCARLELEL